MSMRFDNAPKCQVVQIGLEESRLVRQTPGEGALFYGGFETGRLYF